MTSREITFDAFRLARKGEVLRGDVSLAELPRLAQSVLSLDARLHYTVEGRVDDEGQPGALMSLLARLPLRCERCNEPLVVELQRVVPFRFVRSEEELNALPIEDDAIEEAIGSTAMPLLPWIEDEAILSLPLVPRHADCRIAARFAAPAEDGEGGRPNPFAALAALKQTTDRDDPADR